MKICFVVAIMVCSIHGYSQVDANRFQNIVQSVSSGSAAYGSGFQGRYSNDGRIIGDPYLDSTFVQTTFKLFKNNSFIKTPTRYDLLNDELEIKTTGGVKVLRGSLIESFSIAAKNDSVRYVNAAKYKYQGTSLIGFFEIMSEGKIQLLKQTKIEITKPTYNPSLEVGDRNAYLIKKESIFYSVNGELNKAKGKKEILALFGTEKEKIVSFVDSNNLDWKSAHDLTLIFNRYNELAK